MFKVFVLILVFLQVSLSLLACAEETKSPAKSWWLEVEFQPKCSPIFNEHFSDSLGCYSLLTRDLLARKSSKYLTKLDELNFFLMSMST